MTMRHPCMHQRGGEEADKSDIASANNESKAESKTKNNKRTGGGTMSTLWLSVGDNGVSCLGWGPSWTVLHKSKESSSVLGNDNALNNLEELSCIDTKEVEGFHDGNAPNHSATQQPTTNAADVLQDCIGLQTAHGELSLKVKSGYLNPVLCTYIKAMMRLLNLFLDSGLGYTWIKALLVVAKSEGHGTTHMWSIQK
jgi:hypothetical protein